MKDLKNSQDVSDMLKSKEPVAVFFYMSRCPHCKTMHGPWESIEKQKPDMKFFKVESEFVPSDLGISGYPEFRIVRDGVTKKSVGGEMDSDSLKRKLFGGGSRSTRLTRRVRKGPKRTSRRHIGLGLKLRATSKRRR